MKLELYVEQELRIGYFCGYFRYKADDVRDILIILNGGSHVGEACNDVSNNGRWGRKYDADGNKSIVERHIATPPKETQKALYES